MSLNPVPRISVITPAYNEEEFLPRLLDSIDAARARYRGGANAIEVIISDNVSTDRTAEIARERGCTVARVEKRIIGAVRNGGVKLARGEIFFFVDADLRLHPETLNAIEDVMQNPKAVGGITGVRSERMSPGIFVTFALAAPIGWVTKLSTGPAFCRREDYEAVGGYSEEKLFGEDIKFLRDLKQLGRSRRQKLIHAKGVKGTMSHRKMDLYGDWHILKIIAAGIYYRIVSPRSMKERREKFAKSYWYSDKK